MTTEDAYRRVIDALDAHGSKVNDRGSNAIAQCPAHDDHNPSLSLRQIEGSVLLNCFAGCATDDVVAELGLSMADLFDNKRDVEYRYGDGRVVTRRPGKRFSQSGNTTGAPELYRLSAVRAAVAGGRPIYLVEGEQDVHALESLGVTATTAPMGASNFDRVDVAPLTGATVIAVPDEDEAGTGWLARVQAKVGPIAASLTAAAPKVGKDAADHITAGYGLDELIEPSKDPEPSAALAPAPAPADNTNDPLPDEPVSELGHARRLVYVHGSELRYVPAWRRWLIWDGRRWALDSTGQAARWAKVIARQVTNDALLIGEDRERKHALALARRGESAAGVAGALTLAGTEPGIALGPEELDADPWLLNCRNGTLDLRTDELRHHDPADRLTKLTGADYDANAAGPEFMKFLEHVQPDSDMRSYLARLFGHSLEGRVSEHVLPIQWGEGANGKGTFITAVLGALGDYGDAADPDLLTARNFDAHPTGVADLFGLRLAVLHETDKHRRLAEATVKRLTGGDRLKARRMREDFWHFEPSHTFVMLTNHKPIVAGTDEGIWRRLRLVPWGVTVPDADQDGELGDKLALESAAVLAWLVAGHRDWRAQGMAEPKPVTAATLAYRHESDSLGAFLDACLLGAQFKAQSSALFTRWQSWCDRGGEQPGTAKGFATALEARGYTKSHTITGSVWAGIGLPTTTTGPEPEAAPGELPQAQMGDR